MNTKEAEAHLATAKKEGFERWMAEPLTRAMLSTIPAGDNPDMLKALLQAAFDTGVGTGSVATALGRAPCVSCLRHLAATPRRLAPRYPTNGIRSNR